MLATIYAIRDSKTSAFQRPLTIEHAAQAIRGLTTAVNDPECEIGRFPEDFDLYEIGEFNNTSGKLIAFDAPRFVASGISCVKKTPTISTPKE